MTRQPDAHPRWWARGLLFENCSCTIVCPGHVHFEQRCTFERCVGFWVIRFDAGEYGSTPLGGCAAVVAYDSPQIMIEGGWTESLIVDAAATEAQTHAVEAILTGAAGGPWGVLARFVAHRLPTALRPIRIDDGGTVKTVRIEGLLDTRIEAIRGRDRSAPVTFENIFNQVHSPSQVIARGSSSYDDGEIVVDTDGTHALYSEFDWSVLA